jgi:hypothetical protein
MLAAWLRRVKTSRLGESALFGCGHVGPPVFDAFCYLTLMIDYGHDRNRQTFHWEQNRLTPRQVGGDVAILSSGYRAGTIARHPPFG